MLELETHLEGMFAVNLGEVVGHLEGGTNFVGRQKSVTTQGLQSLDSERRKSAIFVLLGNTVQRQTVREARSDHWLPETRAWCEDS